MAIWNLFSKREKRRLKAGQEDVFQYDELPQAFRAQVIHIWRDALSTWHHPGHFTSPLEYPPNVWWNDIFSIITREKGVFALSQRGDDPCTQCFQYLMESPTADALDLIEVAFSFIDRTIRRLNEYERQHWGLTSPDRAIQELNGRFREHGIGYEFAGGEIIRVDSRYIHAEAVKPALQLLHDAGRGFAGPLDEFMEAHKHHRKGENKDAIVWACKAYESTLKAICTARRWPFDSQKDTASKLIEIVFNHGLIPLWIQGQFTALRSVMDSGINTVRNKTSGHGQGPAPLEVPEHLVQYALNLTAANIVLLIQAHQATP